jgi:predicted nucleotidyltransferase
MGLAERLWNKENTQIPNREFFNDIKTVVGDLVKIDPECKIFVFGSVANNTAGIHSDIDMAVFIKNELDLRVFRALFYRNRIRIPRALDLIFRHQSALQPNENTSELVEEILSRGIEVYPDWRLNG